MDVVVARPLQTVMICAWVSCFVADGSAETIEGSCSSESAPLKRDAARRSFQSHATQQENRPTRLPDCQENPRQTKRYGMSKKLLACLTINCIKLRRDAVRCKSNDKKGSCRSSRAQRAEGKKAYASHGFKRILRASKGSNEELRKFNGIQEGRIEPVSGAWQLLAHH
jgi:hypothetical protein